MSCLISLFPSSNNRLPRVLAAGIWSAIFALASHWWLCDTALAEGRIAPRTQASSCTHSIRLTGHDRYPNRDLLSMPEVFSGLMETPATHALIVQLTQPMNEFFKVKDVAQNVHVIFDSDYAAFSTPDNNVYVTSGVLQRAHSDQEVMAVIAHELGHVRCGHPNVYESTQHAKWTKAVAILGFGAIGSRVSTTGNQVGAIGSRELPDITIKFARAGRSRDNEFAADRVAVDALMATKGSSAGVHAFLSQIISPDADTGKTSALEGADHPNATDRLEHLRGYERTTYPDLSDPLPLEHLLLDQWRAEDSALILAVSRVETAAQLAGAPFVLFGKADAMADRARNAGARSLLSDAYSTLAASIGPNGAALSNLNGMWLTKWTNAELEARTKFQLHQDISEQMQMMWLVLKDPHTPEWFTYVCGLLAAKMNQYADAERILAGAKAQYSDLSPIYPLYIAVVAGQERTPLRAVEMLSLVTACGVSLDVDLNAACNIGLNNPKAYIDQQWTKYYAHLAETPAQFHQKPKM